jgi:hypothetical protein
LSSSRDLHLEKRFEPALNATPIRCGKKDAQG